MSSINEIAPDVYRISTYVPEFDDLLTTGKYRYRLVHTPHLPHGWDAGMLFEETQRTLFCSDLFHQGGDVEPSTELDVISTATNSERTWTPSELSWAVVVLRAMIPNGVARTAITVGHLIC